jgi:ribonucleotide monophosphatase NagD (HAD superfamily)
MPDGAWPGSGAILAAVETATGVPAALLVGKPERPFYEAALERLGPGRVLGVGDRLELDVAGAHGAGLDAALVLTGSTTRAEAAAADPAPAHVAESLADLVLRD